MSLFVSFGWSLKDRLKETEGQKQRDKDRNRKIETKTQTKTTTETEGHHKKKPLPVAQGQLVSGDEREFAFVSAGAKMLPRRVEDRVLDVRRGRVRGHREHQTTHQTLLIRKVLGVDLVLTRLVQLVLGGVKKGEVRRERMKGRK